MLDQMGKDKESSFMAFTKMYKILFLNVLNKGNEIVSDNWRD